ncbi:MAG: DUF371 domain-containing protein [Desulfurococcales archaeon]|nr:DUF371 domain-containing protein [Desulfurococcales archaeon]
MPEYREGWFIFKAKGHHNVRALHRTTLEITKESHLTPRGDCIIGIESEAALADLPEELKESIRRGLITVVVFCAGGVCDSVVGSGHPGLTLEDPVRMIIRRSRHIDGKTLMICSNKAARDVDRRIIEALKKGETLMAAISVLPLPHPCSQVRV